MITGNPPRPKMITLRVSPAMRMACKILSRSRKRSMNRVLLAVIREAVMADPWAAHYLIQEERAEAKRRGRTQ